jgi:hypothetical protein
MSEIRKIRKVVLGCTDRGQHQWTTLYTIRYHAQIQPGEDVVQWVPTLPGTWFSPGPCPRCDRDPRFGHDAMTRLLTELEPRTREGQGRITLDISRLPI